MFDQIEKTQVMPGNKVQKKKMGPWGYRAMAVVSERGFGRASGKYLSKELNRGRAGAQWASGRRALKAKSKQV